MTFLSHTNQVGAQLEAWVRVRVPDTLSHTHWLLARDNKICGAVGPRDAKRPELLLSLCPPGAEIEAERGGGGGGGRP